MIQSSPHLLVLARKLKDFWELGQHQRGLEKGHSTKQSKFIKIHFLLYFFFFFSSVKSVCLSRCFIFGLDPPASCEAFFVAFLCLLLPGEITGTFLCEFSVYYD